MTYAYRLQRWAIVRLLPNQRWVVVARFYSRSDAEGHLQFLRRSLPLVRYEMIFDLPATEPE